MQKKYPCKGCVEKYTNQFNEVDTPNERCGMCVGIARRKGEVLYCELPGEMIVGIDISEPGAELSTIQVIDRDGRARLIIRGRVN